MQATTAALPSLSWPCCCHMNAKFCAPTAVICLMSSLNCVWAALGLQLLTEGPLISADGANRKHCSAIWCKHRESDSVMQTSTVIAHLPDCLLAAESQLIHCCASATNKKTREHCKFMRIHHGLVCMPASCCNLFPASLLYMHSQS